MCRNLRIVQLSAVSSDSGLSKCRRASPTRGLSVGIPQPGHHSPPSYSWVSASRNVSQFLGAQRKLCIHSVVFCPTPTR
ncbi:hypothetical protein CSUI_008644 [Cystoisospora suis]|uniref:Uncharacterized protein n=1 Tax=Cystoisospora suis TaxID=483139 RepID=A0A2C6KLN9_9APIC|nr:hypothetical protein CSUI_008644 [Cystoisospora suis]